MAEETHDFSTPTEHRSLGIAGRTARLFITSPVTPMLLIAALLTGLMGLFFTPRQEDPQISVPMVDIFVQYPGTSAQQVASLVTDPLERIMAEIPGVRHTYTATERGKAIVTVRFYVGQDLGESIVKVHDKLQSNLDKMPPGVTMPLVKPVAVDDVPVVALTLWSEDVDDGALRTLAMDVLQRLGEVKDAGKGFVVGGREDEIRVEVLSERLSGFGISLPQVAETIQTANSEMTAGGVETGGTTFTVRTGSFLKTSEDIERLVVGVRHGAPVYVRDVARVTHEPTESVRMSSFYTGPAYAGDNPAATGEQAVTIAIAKKEKTNGVVVATRLVERIEALKGDLIPSNVHVEITRNYGKTANDKVNELLRAMLEAAVIVAILCLIGLGARAAFVVITVIPVVILLTIWWAMMIDYTIDRVSLFALIFSIGILVDDATVVVENIFRHWLLKGKTSITTAVDAVREVGNPTILATFTIVAALLPMGWVSGLMGPYMRPIPVLGSSAMVFSLIAAFVFTPWFAVKVAPRLAALEKASRKEKKAHERIRRFYRPIITPLIENRFLGITFLVSIIALTAALCVTFYTQQVVVKMLPFDNKPEFSVIVNLPEGTAMPVTANLTNRLADELLEMPEVTAVQTYAGTAQPFNFNGLVRHYYLRQNAWDGELQVLLVDKDERERSSHQIAEYARSRLKPIAESAGARIMVVEMPPGPPVLQTVVAEIHGPDAATRREVAADMMGFFEKSKGVVDVDTYMAAPYDYWHFEVDTEKAVRRGISVDTINKTLAMAMGGFKLGDIKRGTVLEPTYIVIQVPLAVRSSIASLGDLPVPTNDGRMIPLSELGKFIKVPEDPIIFTKDLRDIEYVVAEMEGRLGAPIYGMLNIEDYVKEYTAPDGVQMTTMPMNLFGPPKDDYQSGYEWEGEWTVTFETFRDMGIAFMGALVLIYGLIVWEFKNFAIAGLIMSPIPLTMIGIIPGHWIMGAEFTATSMIGMIALGGIIVRQSILIVEFVKIEVANGNDVKEAAIRGAEMRMRPIFITSLTLMAGAFAILQDPIFNGMAISLLFGAGVATVMALIVIPLGCISARKQFYVETSDDGTVSISPAYERVEGVSMEAGSEGGKTSLLMRLWGGFFAAFSWVFYIIRALFSMLGMGFKALFGKSGGGTPPPPRAPSPGGTPPPPRGGTPPPPREVPSTAKGTPPPPREVPSTAKGTPPPPREVPSTAKGTPPSPREAPPAAKVTPPPPRKKPAVAKKDTAPPPREKPAAKKKSAAKPLVAKPAATKAVVDDGVDHSGEASDEISETSAGATGDDETVTRKRRGIRLKQDLS